MTLPEILIWQRIKGAKTGHSFRKQHPIGPYIVDFYCAERASVIEIDGEVHARGDAPQRDVVRDAFLVENSYRILRIPAAEVLKDVSAAVQGIVAFVESPLHQPAAGPPPRAGEELL